MPDMTALGRDPLAGSPTGGAADVSRHPAAIRHQRSHLQSARGPFCHGLPGAAQDELSARCDQPRSASHAGSWCGPVLSFQPEQARGPAPGQTVTFGIQPEHCHPVRDRRAKRRGGKPGLVTIRVALVGPTGPETIPVATLAGQEVTISCKPDDRPPVGMDCALAIDRTSDACSIRPPGPAFGVACMGPRMDISPTFEPIKTSPGAFIFCDVVRLEEGAAELRPFVHFHPQVELVWFRKVSGSVKLGSDSIPLSDGQCPAGSPPLQDAGSAGPLTAVWSVRRRRSARPA